MAAKSAAEFYAEANSLFVDENYEAALKSYTKAVELDQQNVDFLLKRSACQLKLKHLEDAVADASVAVKLAPGNPNAYLRKGMALFAMDEFLTAKAALEKGASLDPSNTQFKLWLRKCEAELQTERGDTKPAEINATQPKPPAPAPMVVSTPAPAPTPVSAPAASAPAPTPAAAPAASATPAPVHAAPEKKGPRIKHEWFQSANAVEIGIFVRNVKKEQVELNVQEKSMSVHIKLSADETYALDLELCDTVIPEKTEVEYLPPKVEIKLVKRNLVKWSALERPVSAPVPVQAWADTSQVDKNKYPTSSKKSLDWAAIDKSVEEDKLEGDAALNKVFQDIFKNGSEEQRRAMMKSFVESGGTVLSTNWDEVGKGEVKGSPPKGLEMKKWGED